MDIPKIGSLSPKWQDEQFCKEQLQNHLFEVGHLMTKKDPHALNELADLLIIAHHILVESGRGQEIVDVRFEKFKQKAKGE